MRQVFISYSTKDQVQAEAVRNIIEQNGISCWMAPRDIPGGSNYTKEIPIAIRGCQAFVLMLSENAQNSHWVLKELDSAVNAGKTILPFQLEDITLNDEFNFLLTGAQRYDAYQKKAEALQNLVQRIKAIVEMSPAAQEEPAPAEEAPQEPAPKKPAFEFKKPEKKEPDMSAFIGAVCPACGSADVKQLPTKYKARDFLEHVVCIAVPVILAVALPVVTMVLASILAVIIPILTDVVLADPFVMFLLLVVPVLGVILGNRLTGEWLRRRRVRSHTDVSEYRCNACQKKFEVVSTDGAVQAH